MPQWLSYALLSLVTAGMLWICWAFLIRPYSYRWRPCSGSKEYGACIPDGYAAYGIDVSHHQGTIDWDKVTAAGKQYKVEFVFLKATEGGTFKDENYDENIAAARAAGLRCGSYHFYNPATSPGRQAEFFIASASVLNGDLPPVLDLERRGGQDAQFQREVLEWLRIVERRYGIKPIIYTSYKFKTRYLTDPVFDEYTFWIAHYYVEKPAQDCGWTLWQFTDRGRVPGIEGYTDMNVFSGSRREFSSFSVK